MLAGMGLMKLGVFSVIRSGRFHRNLMVAGYGLGIPLAAFAAHEDVAVHPVLAARFGAESLGSWQATAMLVGSAAVALGHVGLVMHGCRAGWWPRLRSALGAAGRMALTNYLAQTLICILVFDGWAFGLWGRFGIAAQLLLVLAISAVQPGPACPRTPEAMGGAALCRERPAVWVAKALPHRLGGGRVASRKFRLRKAVNG
jgi:uncharacterized protein